MISLVQYRGTPAVQLVHVCIIIIMLPTDTTRRDVVHAYACVHGARASRRRLEVRACQRPLHLLHAFPCCGGHSIGAPASAFLTTILIVRVQLTVNTTTGEDAGELDRANAGHNAIKREVESS